MTQSLGFCKKTLFVKKLENRTLSNLTPRRFWKIFCGLGDFWVCQGYARSNLWRSFGEDKQADMIDFFIPPEGRSLHTSTACGILKDAPHYDLANEFINFIQRPEIYAQFLDAFSASRAL